MNQNKGGKQLEKKRVTMDIDIDIWDCGKQTTFNSY